MKKSKGVRYWDLVGRLLLLNLFVCSAIFGASAQHHAAWKEVTTVEGLYELYPNLIEELFESYNLDFPGLEKVKQAADSGYWVEAGNSLLDYYRYNGHASHLRVKQPEASSRSIAEADTTLNDVFFVQNVRGKVPLLPDGHRDWYYKGPNNDREWAWLSNRHTQINQVLSAYYETGNPKYAKYIDLFLRDFIVKSMPYPAEKRSESIWRGLEVAARAKVWSRIFYGMVNDSNYSASTLILMLSSLPDHAHYNRNFHAGNNWLTMEISALATVATNFPEFKNAEEWLDYSILTMTESMKGQVYPDGVQTELTSHYHNVALKNFDLFKEICDRANRQLPDFFNQTLEQMYSYIAHVVRPDGNRILNNDGDRGSDVELIENGAKIYNHPEWEYIISNGKKGTAPADGPSYFYPWAGHLISRSGFDADAHWSFFDVGPWGSGHQHNDRMHISISAFGRDLLVDGGRFAYTGEVATKYRPYARGSQSHNVILIDGQGQAAGIPVETKPVPQHLYAVTDEADYASGTFEEFINVEGSVRHTRSVLYVHGQYWIVVDNIITDRPREIDVLWHWHPECEVVKQKKRVVSTANERGNLAVIPVSKGKWDIDFIKGQETPEIQGWYSEEYNRFEPNVATIYSSKIKSNTTFVWLLQPFEGAPEKVKAKVTSESQDGVSVQMKTQNGNKSTYFIPYNDSGRMIVTK